MNYNYLLVIFPTCPMLKPVDYLLVGYSVKIYGADDKVKMLRNFPEYLA